MVVSGSQRVVLKTKNFYSFRFYFMLAVFFLTTSILSACHQQVRKRPHGFISLGKIEELSKPVSFLSDKGLLLRQDSGGFYVMSILCTYDLGPLEVKQAGDKQVLAAKYTTSTYDLDGQILSGPAQASLPYYEIVAAASIVGGPVDSLYARIGNEKPKDWRLKVATAVSEPKPLDPAAQTP